MNEASKATLTAVATADGANVQVTPVAKANRYHDKREIITPDGMHPNQTCIIISHSGIKPLTSMSPNLGSLLALLFGLQARAASAGRGAISCGRSTLIPSERAPAACLKFDSESGNTIVIMVN